MSRGHRRRILGRTRALIGAAAGSLLVVPWLIGRPGSAAVRALERRLFRQLRRGVGLGLEVQGSPAPLDGTLFVANHVSWADIALFGSVIDAHFVAKTEVAEWPVIGALARRLGPVFVARDQRHGVSAQADAIRERLQAGEGVILFPEGTTSDGSDVLPFRTSLFAAADAAKRVQPVAIIYAAPDGSALPETRLAEIGWTGEEGLLANAAALARHATLGILHFLPSVDPRNYPDRKTLADQVRASIRDARL